MAGMKGRSGGHNRISAEEHVLRGTFRPERHGALALRPAAVAVRALTARAEELEAVGTKLVQRGARSKLVLTRRDGPQMDPRLAAGLTLLKAASEIWQWLSRISGAGDDPHPDPLDAFRRKRHPNGHRRGSLLIPKEEAP